MSENVRSSKKLWEIVRYYGSEITRYRIGSNHVRVNIVNKSVGPYGKKVSRAIVDVICG